MSFASREERTQRARLGGPGRTERGVNESARQRRAADAQQNVQLNFAAPLHKQADDRIGVKTDTSLRIDSEDQLTVVPFLEQERGTLVATSTTGATGSELDRTWVVQGKVDRNNQMQVVTSTTAGYTTGIKVLPGRVFHVLASISVHGGGNHIVRVRATDEGSATAGTVIASSSGNDRDIVVHALVDLRARSSGEPVVIHVSLYHTSGASTTPLAQFITIKQVA